jgi:hypothetical protein
MIPAAIYLIALLNASRGAGAFDDLPGGNRLWAVAGMGAVLYMAAVPLWWLKTPLILFALVMGHGKYFMAFHGRDLRAERECPATDAALAIIERVHALPNRLYGTVGMSLRYLIWSAPLAWFNPVGGMSMALAGPIYAFIPGKEENTRPAELLIGALFGALALGG